MNKGYMSNIYHLYLSTCQKYSILPSCIPGMYIKPNDISKAQYRVMEAMLEIDEALMDLELTRRWFEGTLNKHPFNGQSPINYLYATGATALLEIRIYLTALRFYMYTVHMEKL